ncbi:MAG: DUF4381 domain-containing protein [Legionellales bacterium]
MANNNALAQLKDIHLPGPVSWWPLAPGWYVLLILALLLCLGLAGFFYKKGRHARPKKQALALLARYQQDYEREHNTQLTSARISQLLRRVALVYFPREQVAGLHGDAWVNFLNQTSNGLDFKPVQAMLLEAPFQAVTTVSLKPLLTRAALWIKQRKVPCSN